MLETNEREDGGNGGEWGGDERKDEIKIVR